MPVGTIEDQDRMGVGRDGAACLGKAATRPTMRFVALKSEAQLDQQTLHRARSRLVNGRTRLMDQLRAFLLERGITVAKVPAPRPRGRDSG
jgi:transposase